MKNFFSCIQKDIKNFGRSKFSAFIAVVVPLLVALLISSTFSMNELQEIKVSVYSKSYSSLTESILANFEKQSFKIFKENDETSCTNSVREGNNQICVVFPGDLSKEGNAENVVFYVDNSRINIAYTLIDEVKTSIGIESSEISLDLVNVLIEKINNAKKDIESGEVIIESAASDANAIQTNSEEMKGTIPDLSNVLFLLDKAKTVAGKLNTSDSDVINVKKNLDSAINETTALDMGLAGVYSGIDNLGANSENIIKKLSTISISLNSVAKDLSEIRVNEAEKIVSPIKTEIRSVVDPTKNWNFIFPTLLALMVMFGSIILASVTALREKQNRAYFRNFITPTSDFTFILAMYVSCLFILIVQSLVLFSGLVLATKLPLVSILGNISLILFVSATLFIFMGICIGHFFKSEEDTVNKEVIFFLAETDSEQADNAQISFEHKDFRWVFPQAALKMHLIQDLDACIKLFYELFSDSITGFRDFSYPPLERHLKR